MGEAIGGVLLLAIGVAISPLPIIGVVLMLVTPRGRINGPAFVIGSMLALGIVGAIVLLAAADPTSDSDDPATWASLLKLLFGALLVLLAAKQWRGRPHDGEQAVAPKWMGAVDGFSTPKAFGAGVVLSGANPKNLLLCIAAAVTIAQTGISGGEQAIAYTAFALIGTIGVALPVVIAFTLGEQADPILARLKEWMGQNSGVIMAVLLLLIGAKLIGDAISGLSM